MKYNIQLLPVLILMLSTWTANSYGVDSTAVVPPKVQRMIFAPDPTLPRVSIPLSNSPNNNNPPTSAVCPPDHPTLTELRYTTVADPSTYEWSEVYQPTGGSSTGVCLSGSDKITGWERQPAVKNVGCPGPDYSYVSSSCDTDCNFWTVSACGFEGDNRCIDYVCDKAIKTWSCDVYQHGPAWASIDTALARGPQNSESRLPTYREAICTDTRPSWRPAP